MKNNFVRKTNRLNGYDYSSRGMYFITVCTLNKEHTLWNKFAEAPSGRHNAEENDLLTKSNYIHTNPLKWAEDEFFTY